MDNYILYFVVMENGKKSEKKNNRFAVQLKLAQFLTMPQFKKKHLKILVKPYINLMLYY